MSAEFVAAFVALAAPAELIAALVALAVNAHMGCFVHAEDVAVHLIPSIGIHFQTIAFRELLGAFGIDLRPGNLLSLKRHRS